MTTLDFDSDIAKGKITFSPHEFGADILLNEDHEHASQGVGGSINIDLYPAGAEALGDKYYKDIVAQVMFYDELGDDPVMKVRRRKDGTWFIAMNKDREVPVIKEEM